MSQTTPEMPWSDRIVAQGWLEANERRRQERRARIREMVGHPISDKLVEQIVALSTGLEALYDLGEPQDEIICRYLRKHRDQNMWQVFRRATWVFVAYR